MLFLWCPVDFGKSWRLNDAVIWVVKNHQPYPTMQQTHETPSVVPVVSSIGLPTGWDFWTARFFRVSSEMSNLEPKGDGLVQSSKNGCEERLLRTWGVVGCPAPWQNVQLWDVQKWLTCWHITQHMYHIYSIYISYITVWYHIIMYI